MTLNHLLVAAAGAGAVAALIGLIVLEGRFIPDLVTLVQGWLPASTAEQTASLFSPKGLKA